MIGPPGVLQENVSVRLWPRAAVSQFHNGLLVLLVLAPPFRGGPSWRRAVLRTGALGWNWLQMRLQNVPNDPTCNEKKKNERT